MFIYARLLASLFYHLCIFVYFWTGIKPIVVLLKSNQIKTKHDQPTMTNLIQLSMIWLIKFIQCTTVLKRLPGENPPPPHWSMLKIVYDVYLVHFILYSIQYGVCHPCAQWSSLISVL